MKRARFFIKFVFLCLVALLAYNIFISNYNPRDTFNNNPDSRVDSIFHDLGLFADAVTLVDKNYVREISSKEIVYGALDGMLSSLDSHSAFLSPEQHSQLKEDSMGEFGGLGIKVTFRDKVLTVVSPLEGTPAHKAGLMPGDRIIKIDDKSTKDFNLDDAVEALRGMPGTAVKLTIIKDSDQSIVDIDIKRAIIKIESIRHALMLTKGTGYIRIADFQRHTAPDLSKAIRKLIQNGMKNLVLDLRNNPGGLLEASIMACERFLKKPDIIVSTKGRIEEQNVVFKSRALRAHTNFPIVVLINKGSASGSEIVAGAIRDNKRGLIAGEASFGKASVQTVIPMKDNSALRLTTSYYYTPSGEIIHDKGIVPDILVAAGYLESDTVPEYQDKETLDPKQLLLRDKQVIEAIKLINESDRYMTLLN